MARLSRRHELLPRYGEVASPFGRLVTNTERG
jgi:hypothetical protein